MKIRRMLLGFCLLTWASLSNRTWADDETTAGVGSVEARAYRWLAVNAPISGDDNNNGYTCYELSTSPVGPFSPAGASWQYVSGRSEWRTVDFANYEVRANTTYYVRIAHFDPDGVDGPNPQIVGPMTTPIARGTSRLRNAAPCMLSVWQQPVTELSYGQSREWV